MNTVITKYLIAAVIFISLSAYIPVSQASEQVIVHVVMLWLKEPGNHEHQQGFINACKDFKDIPGVLDFRIGKAVASDRAIVDDSFDVGLYVTLANKEALNAYLQHPIHLQAVATAKPLIKKLLAYDFQDQQEAE